MIKAIMDYRAMEQAKRLHNEDPTKMTPGQMELWREMVELAEKATQNG